MDAATKLFLVLMMRRPSCDPSVLPAHQAFLSALRERQQLERSGPFADGSGGAYLLRAADQAQALAIAQGDPAYLSGGWDVTVYEWRAS